MKVNASNIIFRPSIKQFLPLALLIAVVTGIFYEYLILAAPLLIIAYLFRSGKTNEILILVLSSLLIFTSNNFESIRIYLNIASILLLAYLYVDKNGISVKSLPTELNYFFLFIIASLIITYLATGMHYTSLQAIIRQVAFFLIIFLLYSLLNYQNAYKVTGFVLSIVGIVVAGSVLFQIITKASELSFAMIIFERFSGIYNNPNGVGLIMAVVIPLYLTKLFTSISNIKKTIYSILLAVFVLVLFATNSRASILSVLVSSSLIIFYFNRRTFYTLFGAASIIAVLLLIVDTSREVIVELFRLNRLSDARALYWNISWDIIKTNPVFGSGPDLFGEYIYKFLPVKLNSFMEGLIWHGKTGTSHNFILFRWTEMGILGLISAFYFIYIIYIISVKVFRYYKNNSVEHLNRLIAFFAVIAGLLIRSLFESTGLLTHGWITRDLPFWLCFLVIIIHYAEIRGKSIDIEDKSTVK